MSPIIELAKYRHLRNKAKSSPALAAAASRLISQNPSWQSHDYTLSGVTVDGVAIDVQEPTKFSPNCG